MEAQRIEWKAREKGPEPSSAGLVRRGKAPRAGGETRGNTEGATGKVQPSRVAGSYGVQYLVSSACQGKLQAAVEAGASGAAPAAPSMCLWIVRRYDWLPSALCPLEMSPASGCSGHSQLLFVSVLHRLLNPQPTEQKRRHASACQKKATQRIILSSPSGRGPRQAHTHHGLSIDAGHVADRAQNRPPGL